MPQFYGSQADAAGNDARFVLVDFGAARCLESGDERCTSLVGTLAYLAPEVLSRNGHGMHVDWWSLGVLLYEARCGKHPFLPDDLSDGDNSCACAHFELSEAQKAMTAERLTESLMACCEEGEKAEGAILVSLVVPALRHDPIERADGSHAWAADHPPSAFYMPQTCCSALCVAPPRSHRGRPPPRPADP